jgi:EAL domain-containing protein (putative c-di-GMP-specific phosphodiesterase class I)
MVSVEDMINEALDASGLAPSRLIIEITETALIEQSARVSRALAEMRRLGVGVALDDFGTGYSSLSYLRAIAFTKIKIDRSFIVDIESNERSQRLLSNITRMSHDLDMTVTVEGIETEEQLKMVGDLADIEHAQGYLFGAPLPSKDIEVLINRVGGYPPESKPATRKAAR